MAAAMEGVLGARPSSSAQDLVLCVELGCFFLAWLKEGKHATQSTQKKLFFVVYGMELLGASLWCGLGAYMHSFEPLPTEATVLWAAFLLLGAVTPVLFPVVILAALDEKATVVSAWSFAPLQRAIGVGMAYTAIALSGADLTCGGIVPLPSVLQVTPWHSADGRSYGGGAHGLKFDLLSSYPSYQGNSMFVLSTLFLASCFLSVIILWRRGWGGEASANEMVSAASRRLCGGIFTMCLNCIALLYLIVVFEASLETAFAVFHVLQGLIMAAAFLDLRRLLRLESPKTA
eukprot:TRINITY_DN22294_c0_g1_i1.p1 TRINITY_DN22294_c0_g1~~TRINITY_DN22294_c0_g1_i1.p1  ORF type:complete len:289 (+),score=59.61 TRINITY_DN22294_c0_g1_i1:196-1062(+)